MATENRFFITYNADGTMMIGMYPGLGTDLIVRLLVGLVTAHPGKTISVVGLTDEKGSS